MDLTTRSNQAVSAAVKTAAERGNPAVEPAHLAVALLDDTEGLTRPMLQKLGVDPARDPRPRPSAWSTSCPAPAATASARRPPAAACSPCSAPPSARPAIAPTTSSAPRSCCSPWPRRRATSPTLLKQHGVTPAALADALQDGPRLGPRHHRRPRGHLRGAREVRHRPHPAGPRRQDRPGHRPRRRDPPRRPGAVAAGRRTTPCSSASPASARPPSSKGWPSASSPATCPRACAASGSSPSTSAR